MSTPLTTPPGGELVTSFQASRQLTTRYFVGLIVIALIPIVLVGVFLHTAGKVDGVLSASEELAGVQDILFELVDEAEGGEIDEDSLNARRREVLSLYESAKRHSVKAEASDEVKSLEPHVRESLAFVEGRAAGWLRRGGKVVPESSVVGDLRRLEVRFAGVEESLQARLRSNLASQRRFLILAVALLGLVIVLEAALVFRPAVVHVQDAIGALHDALDRARRSEADKQAILDAMPDTLVAFHPDGSLTVVVGQQDDEILALASRAACRTTATGQTISVECQVEDRWFEIRAVRSMSGDALAVIRDTSDRRRLERSLLEVSQQEQKRFGQELHDGVCQELAGFRLLLKGTEARLNAGETLEPTFVPELVELVENALQSARSLSRGLYPVDLSRRGLEHALMRLAEVTETTHGLRCVVQTEIVQPLDPHTELQLFRIAQEATSNAARHSGGAEIRIDLLVSSTRVILTICDDGKGIDSEIVGRTGGIGLSSMAQRARVLGGALEIRPREPKGTRVELRFDMLKLPDPRVTDTSQSGEEFSAELD